MIAGIPLQTQSPGPHTRGYGCFVHVLAAMIQDQCGEVLTPEEMRDLVVKGIDAGLILDNDLPVDGSKGEWYRCFVLYPVVWCNLVADHMGHKMMELCEIDRTREYISTPTLANYLIIEHSDRYGSHFTLGEIDQKTWAYRDVYNPWPGLPTTGVKGFRRWEVRK